MIFFHLISTKHPSAKCSPQFPSLWHHSEGAKHRALQALPCPRLCSGTGREKGFWALLYQAASSATPCSKIIQQHNSPASPAASRL